MTDATETTFGGYPFDEITVLGAGIMGHGIALAFAIDGRTVTLYDVDEEVLEDSKAQMRSVLETFEAESKINEAEISEIEARITRTGSLEDAVDGADFVTEAVVENLDVKQEVFSKLNDLAPEDAILATNTSGLSITEIASVVDRPERVVGTHWFNPPYVVPLVEVIFGDKTDEAAAEAVYEFMDATGKTPVRVKKDIPGFIGNRIQIAMAYEAFSLLEQGVATPKAIDRTVKAGFGFRLPLLGIFEKADHSGLDVQYEVEKYLLSELDRGIEPKRTLEEHVDSEEFGLKTEKGIYDWDATDPAEIYEQRDRALLSILDTYRENEMETTPRKPE